jgi:hypothetical protein
MKIFDFLSEGISLTTYWNPEPLKTSFLMSHRFMIFYGFFTSLLGYNLVRVKNVVYHLFVWLSWNCIENGSKMSDQVLRIKLDPSFGADQSGTLTTTKALMPTWSIANICKRKSLDAYATFTMVNY